MDVGEIAGTVGVDTTAKGCCGTSALIASGLGTVTFFGRGFVVLPFLPGGFSSVGARFPTAVTSCCGDACCGGTIWDGVGISGKGYGGRSADGKYIAGVTWGRSVEIGGGSIAGED